MCALLAFILFSLRFSFDGMVSLYCLCFLIELIKFVLGCYCGAALGGHSLRVFICIVVYVKGYPSYASDYEFFALTRDVM